MLSGGVDAAHADRDFVSAIDGDVLIDNDRVRTGGDGHALLTFFDASTLEVEPSTNVVVQSAKPSGDATDIRIQQTIGRTWSSVQHLTNPASRYEIHTPSAVAAVRGTGMDVTVLQDGTTTVRVTDGVAVVTASGQTVVVNGGQQSTTAPGGAPGPAAPISAPPNSLRFGMHSPAYIAVVDSAGRSCGVVLPGPTVVRQIVGCLATAPGIEPQVVDVPGASPGSYRVAIYASGEGPFTLTATGVSGDKVTFNDVQRGSVHPGDLLASSITVQGASDGTLRSNGLAAPTLVSSEPVKVVNPSPQPPAVIFLRFGAPSAAPLASGPPPTALFPPLPSIGFDVGPTISSAPIAQSSAAPSSAPPSSAPPSSAPPSTAPPSTAPPSSAPPSTAPPTAAPTSSPAPIPAPTPAPTLTPAPTAAPAPAPTATPVPSASAQPSATAAPTAAAGPGGTPFAFRTPFSFTAPRSTSTPSPSPTTTATATPTATPPKADQTITFAAIPDHVLADSPLTLSATASSGLPVTLDAAGDCSFDGSPLYLNVGTCTVTASQLGNSNYNAAADIARTFRVVGSIATIAVGTNPNGVAVNATTNRTYVATDSNNVAVIDGGTNQVVATVPVGSNPRGVGVNPVTNKVYVTNSNSNSVSVIDGGTNQVTTTITSVGGVACNSVTCPYGLAVNATTNRVYVANQSGHTVSVIDGATNQVTATVSVGAVPTGVAVNQTTNTIYVTLSNGTVSVINGATDQVTTTIGVGTNPGFLAVNASTNRVYVANEGSNSISVINGATNQVTATVTVGTLPVSVSVNTTTDRVYVANENSNTVTAIDGATNQVVLTVTVGGTPWGIAANAATNRVYVSNINANTVTVIQY